MDGTLELCCLLDAGTLGFCSLLDRPGPEILVAQGETQFEAFNTNIHIKHFLILSVDAYFLDKIVVNL